MKPIAGSLKIFPRAALISFFFLWSGVQAQDDLSPRVFLNQMVTPHLGVGGSWFATKPGRPISIDVSPGSGPASTAPLTNVSVFYRGAKIAENNTVGTYVPFSFTITENTLGEFPIAVVATDSAGLTGRNDGWLRVAGNSLTLLAPQSVLAGDSALVEVKVFPPNGISNISVNVYPPLQPVESPYKWLWTPTLPGDFYVNASGSVAGDHYDFVYWAEAPIRVLPGRLPVALTVTNIPVYARGASVSFEPEILSRSATSIQWLHNGSIIPGATNASLSLENLTEPDQGAYSVHLENFAGGVTADVASVQITNAQPTGGAIDFRTHANGIDAPVREYMPDGPLLDTTSQAQLYAGPSLLEMAPVGPVVRFRNGYVNGGSVQVPNVAPGAIAYVQMYAWKGLFSPDGTYADARSSGNWGKSKILQITTASVEQGGAALTGLEPFGLLLWDAYSMSAFVTPDQTATAGSDVILSASGRAHYTWTGETVTNMKFQWSQNGKALPATQPNLYLNSVQPKDAGIYRVAVTDGLDIKVVPIIVNVDVKTPILAATRSTAGAVTWRLDAAPNTQVAVETSSNLMNWVPWQTVAGSSSPIFLTPPPVSNSSLYVRAVAQ